MSRPALAPVTSTNGDGRPVRIWLNRTFSTNLHVVNMLRNNADGVDVTVLVSDPDTASPVWAAADERYTEPAHLPKAAYLDWAVAFARDHRVDVLIPTMYQEVLAANADRFTAIGTKVLSSSVGAIALFEDREATYQVALALGVPVPDHRVVTTVTEFDQAYVDLRDLGHDTICFKPTRGVGNEGFRVLSNGPRDHNVLKAKTGDHISLAETRDLLAQRESFKPLMVMPFLAGGEASVDTLSLDGDLLSAVPRFKRSTSSVVELRTDSDLVTYAEAFISTYSLSYLNNVRFRFDDDNNPYLLEVNTGASGGLFQSCHAGGNLPWWAVRLALHGEVDVPAPQFPVRLVTVPTAVRL